ncbi:MAG TPA: SIMPL domain-containing protein [Sphingomonas sp.]|nr:SIMPL domain-containing protein [Sphingomonas sp.]
MMHKWMALAALAAIPGFATTAAAQATAPAILPDGTILDVTATGRTTRTPDLATIDAGVVTQAATAAAALSDNSARMAKVLAALKKAGVESRDIATSTVRLNPQYRYAENQPPAITGYQATNTVTVKFHDIAKAGGILDALVAQGANQIDGPNLSLANPDAALDEARTDAVARARARAELYAKAAGLSVSQIVSIDENGENAGAPPPRPIMFARAEAAAPKTDIEPGQTDVTVTLSVRFLLK